MMSGGGYVLPNGAEFPVFKVKVNRREEATSALPQRLSTIKRYDPADAVNREYPKRFHLVMRHMAWTINGRTFRMEDVAAEERVALNSLEIWEFINEGGGMGMMSLPIEGKVGRSMGSMGGGAGGGDGSQGGMRGTVLRQMGMGGMAVDMGLRFRAGSGQADFDSLPRKSYGRLRRRCPWWT